MSMNGRIINSVTRLHLVGYFYWAFKVQWINRKKKNGSIVHLLRYVVKCTVTNSLFNIQASCSKCPTSAWIPFLTSVTRELLTLRSNAVLCKVRSSLVTRVRKGIQADVGHFEQLAWMLNTALQCFVRLEVLWSHESEKVSKQM